MPWFYVMNLWICCYFHFFCNGWYSFKVPYDIWALKISTACDVWFSRYHPSNLMITADFTLVLVYAVKIAATGLLLVLCKYYQQKISERSRLYSGRNGPECKTRYRFRYVSLLNTKVWHYRVCFQGSNNARSSQDNGLWLLHSFANIISHIYSKFHNDLACMQAVMDQNVKQCTVSLYISIKTMVWHYRVCFQGPKSARNSRDNGLWPPPFVCKYYKLYMQQIS